jgi:hypothetical protein
MQPSLGELRAAGLRRVGGIGPAPGQAKRFCSAPCRKRAFRRRLAGLAEDAYRQGAARGRVPLGTLTHAEEREHWRQVAAEIARAREAAA